MKIPYAVQLKEVRREIDMRVRVYGRRVSEGKMTLTESNDKLAIMRAVAETLEPLARAEGLDI